MCDSQGICQIGWKETLPTGCPPADAADVNGEVVFRFLKNEIPEDDDFRSKHLDRAKHLIGVSPCRQRALSVWTSEERARQVLATFRRGGGMRLGRVRLDAGAGLIKQTGPDHVSWWRCGAFDPVPQTTVEPHDAAGN